MEKLYQPDFSSIFGKRFCNAFVYGQIDSLIWPIFNEIKRSQNLQNLLALKDQNESPRFYYRKINLEDHRVELYSSNMSYGLIQAMDLGRKYGICNQDVISVIELNPGLYKGIFSFNLRKDHISELEELERKNQIAGIVVYPSFIQEDLTDKSNINLNELLEYCKNKEFFVKIDLGNINLPENDPSFTNYDKLKLLLSRESEITFILSGIDFIGNFFPYYELVKLYRNLWIEIDPRSLGGMTPKNLFNRLFQIPGFIQNTWNRITIGSATPTLEISQMYRGFIESSEELKFAQKNLLRIWSFRNLNRNKSAIFAPKEDPETFFPTKKVSKVKVVESHDEININFKITLRSFSITQVLSITEIIKQTFNKLMEEYPEMKNGILLIRSYHTTTSLIINEHEFGNYLDLHYQFAELSNQDSAQSLHTVNAIENRADFNHFDHLVASNYGSKQILIPIFERQLEIGSRENFYILVTFGPRSISMLFDFKLYKEI